MSDEIKMPDIKFPPCISFCDLLWILEETTNLDWNDSIDVLRDKFEMFNDGEGSQIFTYHKNLDAWKEEDEDKQTVRKTINRIYEHYHLNKEDDLVIYYD